MMNVQVAGRRIRSEKSQQSTELRDLDLLFFVNVLTQFKLPQVRGDFVNGAFKLPKRYSNLTLSELDCLYNLVFPSFFGWDLESINLCVYSSRCALEMITHRTYGYVELGSGCSISRTHEDWHKILKSLADSPYWRENSLREQPVQPVKVSSAKTNTDPVVSVDVGVCALRIPGEDVGTQAESCYDLAVESAFACCVGAKGVKLGNENNNLHVHPADDLSTRVCSGQSLVGVASCAKPYFPNSSVEESVAKVGLPKVSGHCAWCHKRGHQMESCWRKQGLCLICGHHHHMRDCPRFVAPVPLAGPVCSSCSGDHLGRDCKKIARRILCCYWCGKFGHTEESCWMKKGCCLICGSPDHLIAQCPSFRPRNFQPHIPEFQIVSF